MNFLIEQRETHYERFLGSIDHESVHSDDNDGFVHIDVYTFAPSENRPFYTLITGGMSDARQNVPDRSIVSPRAELMLYADKPKPWMFSVLTGLALMPFNRGTFLSYRHTIPNGMPMTSVPSLLTNYLIGPPRFEPDGFTPMIIDDDHVDILLLIPITDAERELAIRAGADSTLRLLDGILDFAIDEHRSCFVSGKSSPGACEQKP